MKSKGKKYKQEINHLKHFLSKSKTFLFSMTQQVSSSGDLHIFGDS